MVVKSGIRRNLNTEKQIYKCKECGKKFIFNDRFYKKKYPPRIILFVQNRYEMGHSIKEISNEVGKTFEINISLPTLYNWTREYDNVPYSNRRKCDNDFDDLKG